MNHIIFDFDGVLTDSCAFHIENINKHFGVGITRTEYEDLHNGNFYDAPLEKMQKFKATQYPDLVAYEQSRLPLMDRAKEVLDYLHTKHHLHIISSGWERQIRPFLVHHNIENKFTNIFCAEHGKLKSDKFNMLFNTEKITPEQCLFVTDTLGDIREARSVGVDTIAVTFGFHNQERLQEGNPAYIAHSWPEIQNITEEYFK